MDETVHGWAARLAGEDRRALEALRLMVGVEVAADGESLWVRGPLVEGAATVPGPLPASGRFERLADGVLRLPGASVPCGRLPRGLSWTGLRFWMAVELPAPLPPATPADRVRLRLVRGGGETSPDALLLDLYSWTRWASDAPAVRLRPLRFAASVPGLDDPRPAQALVLGTPLPPLPGTRLVAGAGILVPAGWRWLPAVDAATVRQLLGLRTDELAVWPGENLPVSIIPAEAVVPAGRSAARLTHERNQGGLPDHEA